MSRDEILAMQLRELQTKLPPDRALEVKRNGDVWIRCPFHSGGQERTPSFTIFLDPQAPCPPGFFHCLGCKQKGHWNVLAELFGLGTIRKSAMDAAADDSVYARQLNLRCDDPEAPALDSMARWPGNVEWRNIPGPTLLRFEARRITFGRQSYLYLPCLVQGEHVGGINCRLTRDYDNPREKAYINTTGHWSETALFGYDIAARKPDEPLWIVEGPRDTAWIEHCAGRVTGLIGSAVTEAKLRLIRELDPPSIIVATDPDDAGHQAAVKLFDALEEDFPMARFPFRHEKEDPAKIPLPRVQRATELMRRRA